MQLCRVIVMLLSVVSAARGVRLWSSFWAPLWDPRVLQYRVDAAFPPDAGRRSQPRYQQMYGPKGVNLIADLGNGKGPGEYTGDKNDEDVKFYYTYPGAPPP